MKHLQVGFVAAALVLGFLTVFALIAVVLIDQLGLVVLTAGVIVFAVVTIIAATIDWLTEKKETP